MTTESPTSERYWLCPLYSFDCGYESIDLTEGIQIKSAPKALRKYIAERTYHLYGLWEDPSKFDWAAFLPHREKVIEGATIEEMFQIGFEEHDRIGDSLFDLTTALRLIHKGRIVSGPLLSGSINNSEWSIGGTTIWTSVSKLNFVKEEPKYILRGSEVPELNNLLQNMRHWRDTGILKIIDVALRRFHSAYHGPIEDRIIDQMIAFESLYISTDEKGVKKKLSLRTAFLLRNRTDHRNKVIANMKKAYKYRSDIVHDNNPPNRDTLKEVVNYSGDYLRQSILRFLSLLAKGMSIQQIRDKLKESIETTTQNITY